MFRERSYMNIRHAIMIVFYKSIADLKTESSRYFLSFLWWIIDPLIYFVVLYVLFSGGFRGGGQGAEYGVYLIIGLGVYRWFSSTVTSSTLSITLNNNLSQQVYIPKWSFPLNVLFVNSVKFAVIFIMVLIFVLVSGYPITSSYLMLPVVIILEAMLIFGMSLLLAGVLPFIPDLQFAVNNIMMALFFLSGVFNDVSTLSEKMLNLFYWNPVAAIINAYRDILMGGVWPDWTHLLRVFVISTVLILVSYYFVNRMDKVYPKISN